MYDETIHGRKKTSEQDLYNSMHSQSSDSSKNPYSGGQGQVITTASDANGSDAGPDHKLSSARKEKAGEGES